MAEYTRKEARDWAKAKMRGVCGCMLPTFNSSLTKVNERAIRHDRPHQKNERRHHVNRRGRRDRRDETSEEFSAISASSAVKRGLRAFVIALPRA